MTAIEIPGYLIRREIGAGGMASVYLALQTSLERDVALKVMAPALAADPTFSKRFLQEARMLASLAHPNIVQVYDVGVTQAQLNYFSMQYLAGGDFAQRVKGGIGEKELVHILEGVANALGYAHQRGYVHRDVAPGNILFDVNDTPVLTDFGIARAISQAARITSAGISIGTSHYMSPEQARGGDVDARSDLYGLGVLTWFGLTGKPPYEGSDGFAVSYAHVFEPIPRLPAAQAHWQGLVDRALAKDPATRFQSADEFVDALGTIGARNVAVVGNDPDAPTRIIRRESVLAAAAAAAPRPADLPTRIGPIPTMEESGAVGDADAPRQAGSRRWLPWSIAAVGLVLMSLVAYALLAGRSPPVSSARSSDERPARTVPGSSVGTATSSSSADSSVPAETQSSEIAAQESVADAVPEDALAVSADTPESETLDLSKVPTVIDPVVELVRVGRMDLAAQRLTSPPRNNAFERFSVALRIDPKSKNAKQGVVDTARAYLDMADKAWAAGDAAMFAGYLDKAVEVGGSIAEGAESVAAAKARRKREVDALFATAGAAEVRWDRVAARSAYEKILVIDASSGKAREALRTVDRIGAPGFVFRDGAGTASGPEFVVIGRVAFSRREITRGEFARFWRSAGQQQFAGKDPSCRDRESVFRSSRKRTWQAPDINQDDSHPVVCVSFAQAMAYAAWLGKETGQRYRLPTPSEWEQVARGAPAGSCASANLADASFKRAFDSRTGADCDDAHAATAPGGRFAAVAGVFDIDGNAREWVAACGKNSALTGACREHGVRGRGWMSPGDKESVTQPDSFADDVALNTLGFRLVRELDGQVE